jgi:DNA-binding transcriptional LysR family regulator
MDRGSLADLTAFVAVANHLSFRAAATQLGVTPSALSHSMRQLEDRLGVRLLNRTTRSVSVTDAGLRLLERLKPAMGQIDDALEHVNQERQRPFGRLRLHVSHIAAAAVIAPIWTRFLSTFPDVHLDIHMDQATVDNVAKGFDAGIGTRNQVAADMISVRVTGPIKLAVVGSPLYFARRDPPQTPADLARHCCIRYRWSDSGPAQEWPLERNGKLHRTPVNGPLTVNNPDLALRAALDGLGIVYTVEPYAEPFLRAGQLVQVMPDWSPTIEGLFLYYSGRRQVPAALRALIDMIGTIRSTPAKSLLKNPFVEEPPTKASRKSARPALSP